MRCNTPGEFVSCDPLFTEVPDFSGFVHQATKEGYLAEVTQVLV